MDMSRFFKYDVAIKKALENDELEKLMVGEGKYHYEDNLCEGPVDEVKVLASIYKVVEDDSTIADKFVGVLGKLSNGSVDEMLECLQYINIYLLDKQFNDNTFDFEVNDLISDVGKRIAPIYNEKKLSAENEKKLSFLEKSFKTYGISLFWLENSYELIVFERWIIY